MDSFSYSARFHFSFDEEEKTLSVSMVLSAFVRRTLFATAALGGAGVAALTYAGSHDDEPNPEVSFSVVEGG